MAVSPAALSKSANMIIWLLKSLKLYFQHKKLAPGGKKSASKPSQLSTGSKTKLSSQISVRPKGMLLVSLKSLTQFPGSNEIYFFMKSRHLSNWIIWLTGHLSQDMLHIYRYLLSNFLENVYIVPLELEGAKLPLCKWQGDDIYIGLKTF